MIYEVADVKAGKVISIWGPVHRDCAISTTTALLSSLIYCKEIKNHEFRKMLVFSNEVSRNREVSAYLTSDKVPDGLANIYNLVSTGNFKHIRDINPYVYNMDTGFDILGPSGLSEQVLKHLDQQAGAILDICRKVYDYTIVDVAAGVRNLASIEILRSSDMILICVPQDDAVVKSLRNLMKKGDLSVFNEKPYLALVSKYFEDFDHYNLEIIERALGFPLLTVSFNSWIHKITHQREVMQNFKREFSKYAKGSADECIYEFDGIYEEIKMALEEIAEEEEKEKLRLAAIKAQEIVRRRTYINPNKDTIDVVDEGDGTTDTPIIEDMTQELKQPDDSSGVVEYRDDSWLLEEELSEKPAITDVIKSDTTSIAPNNDAVDPKKPSQDAYVFANEDIGKTLNTDGYAGIQEQGINSEQNNDTLVEEDFFEPGGADI